MSALKRQPEKRKSKRFRTSKNAFVIQERYFTGRCQIIDISKSGLAIHHLAGDQQIGKIFDLDLFHTESNLYLENLPVKCIYDEEADTGPFMSLPIRRKGLQFGKLTDEQTSYLDSFIQNTVEERYEYD